VASDRSIGLFFLTVGLLFAIAVIPAQCPKESASTADIPSWSIPSAGMAVAALAGGSLFFSTRRSASTLTNVDQQVGNALTALAAIAAYCIALRTVGYYASTFVAMLLYLRAFARFKWTRSVLMAALFCGAMYAMFELGFRIRLPRGLLS